MIDPQAEELLTKVLNGNAEPPTDQDRLTLSKNRVGIIQHLNTLFSDEISLMMDGEECLRPDPLFWGLKLAGFLEASETSQWLQKLCSLPLETIEEDLGEYFVTDELSSLMADTLSEWSALKVVIENPDLDEFVRDACLKALALCVANGKIGRQEVATYFKSLFHHILNGDLDDTLLCTHLVAYCADIWPGEWLEEIRECFGLTLVDESFVDLDCVVEKYLLGKERCLEKFQQWRRQPTYWEVSEEIPDLPNDAQSQKWDRLMRITDQASDEADKALAGSDKGSQRNELCRCGSGRKYKKCCMNHPSPADIPSKIRIEKSTISYVPLEESTALKALPKDDKESILDLYFLTKENPEEVIAVAPTYIAKYPHIPILYNYLYGAYRMVERPREAIKLLKETVQMFPDYLFGRIEYANYLLRRGEPEKAHAALKNTGTLSQLYPERTVFHAAEWVSFAHVIGLYWLQKNNIDQAKNYLEIIQNISPNTVEIEDLQKKIRKKIFCQSLERLEKELLTV